MGTAKNAAGSSKSRETTGNRLMKQSRSQFPVVSRDFDLPAAFLVALGSRNLNGSGYWFEVLWEIK
jgi:hypothetical protein